MHLCRSMRHEVYCRMRHLHHLVRKKQRYFTHNDRVRPVMYCLHVLNKDRRLCILNGAHLLLPCLTSYDVFVAYAFALITEKHDQGQTHTAMESVHYYNTYVAFAAPLHYISSFEPQAWLNLLSQVQAVSSTKHFFVFCVWPYIQYKLWAELDFKLIVGTILHELQPLHGVRALGFRANVAPKSQAFRTALHKLIVPNSFS